MINKGFSLTCSNADLNDQTQNILYKIYKEYEQKIPFGLNIHLEKNIPMGAGLGGGSANAASFLTFINEHADWNYSIDRLIKIGVKFGADIPFFLYGGNALVRGIGEKIKPLNIKTSNYFLLINPGLNISTPKIFKEFDKINIKAKQPGRTPNSIYNLTETNYLQPVVYNLYPELAALAAEIENKLNTKVIMSGSGSTLFIKLDDQKKAENFEKQLKIIYPDYFVKLTSPIEDAFIIKKSTT